MASIISILGFPASGKSTSIFPNKKAGIKGLDPKKTLYINPTNKDLVMRNWKKHYTPFKGATGNYLATMDTTKILDAIKFVSSKRPDIKNIVIDDASILATGDLMSKAKVKGYEKFVDIGLNIWNLIIKSTDTVSREDLTIFPMYHAEEIKPEHSVEPKISFKLAGKMVQNQLGGIECMFSTILYSTTKIQPDGSVSHVFQTKPSAYTPARSALGMFPSNEIPNDLGLVLDYVNDYFNGDDEEPEEGKA